LPLEQFKLILLVASLTLLSGLADGFGFLHAARVWQEGRIVWAEAGRALLGFGVGTSLYILVLRYIQQLGIVLPEIQSALWFTVAMVSVAVVNGQFIRWSWVDQAIAVAILAGIGWLIVRTGE
jgi:hypothetical protein